MTLAIWDTAGISMCNMFSYSTSFSSWFIIVLITFFSQNEGQERFHALGPIYYRDSHAAILVYDITDQDSFIKVYIFIFLFFVLLASNPHPYVKLKYIITLDNTFAQLTN